MLKSPGSVRTVLVIGEYRQTVTVVRSLARAGLRVTLGCPAADSPTRYSRYVSSVWVYDWARADRFCDQLESYLWRHPHDFVFALGESPLRQLVRMGPRLESLATWVNPDPATIVRCFDKSALYQLTPTLGIPTLPWRRFTDRADCEASAQRMGFPVVMKRIDSSNDVHGRKALICNDASSLAAFLGTLEPGSDPHTLLLQKYQPGRRHNCHVAFADGKLVAYFEQNVLGTDEPDDTGLGTAGMSVPPSVRLRRHCMRLGQALRYTGIGCIQFIVDERSGDIAFLEFNARMDSTALLPYRLGYDYPRIAIELAEFRRGSRPVPAPLTRAYTAGETYHWLLGDLWALINEARKSHVPLPRVAARASAMAWLALRSHHLTFEWSDPMPTLHMYWQQFGRRVARRLHALRLSVNPG